MHNRLTQSNFLRHHWGLLLTAAGALGAYGGLVRLHWQQGTLRAGETPHTLGWYSLAFIAFLLAILWTETGKNTPMKLIWGGAILFRLLLLWTAPTLSDDVYRYIWDGYVATQGVSPYAYPIDSPVLDHLAIPVRDLANNSWMASPYMPVAQFLFAGLAALFPLVPLPFQLSMVLFDLLAAGVLARLLRLAEQPPRRLLLYLWNPLVVVEIAHGAHLDALMIFLTLLAVWWTFSAPTERRPLWPAPILLALATLTKLLPVLLLPVLFWRWRWRDLLLYGLATGGLLLPFGLLSGWGLTGPLDGTGLFGALRIYADQWNFNSGLFHWLETEWLPALGVETATETAKRVIGLALLLVLGGVWLAARRSQSRRTDLRLLSLPLMAHLLLATTVHPWYALPLLAFVPFLAPIPAELPGRWLLVSPWLYLSAALPLSYVTYLDPLDFREFEWVRRLEWPPTLVLAMIGLLWFLLGRRNDVN